MIGAELIQIGHTIYSDQSQVIRTTFESTFRKDTAKVLDLIEMPLLPVSVDHIGHSNSAERLMNDFLKAFEVNSEGYGLLKVLWYLNHGRGENAMTMIQPLSTAFDLLCNAYYRQNTSPRLLDDKEFQELIEPLVEHIRQTAPSSPKHLRIINNIRNANRLTANERHSGIFSELGLCIGTIEKAALAERHKVVHGSLQEEDYPKRIVLSRVFYTLVGRSFAAPPWNRYGIRRLLA